MPDTRRSLSSLQTLLADNTAGDISAQDGRDVLVSNHPEQVIQSAAYASFPSSPLTGDLFLPTNGFHVHRYNGSTWKAFGLSYPLTAVPSSGWTSVGTTTTTNTGGVMNVYSANASGSNSVRGQYRTAPSTPWTATFLFSMAVSTLDDSGSVGQGVADAGVFFRDSTGQYVTYMLQLATNPASKLVAYPWTNSTSISSTYLNRNIPLSPWSLVWMQLYDDGTNIGLRLSPDGVDWTLNPHSQTRGTFLSTGPNAYGFGVNPYSMKISTTLLSLAEA